MNNFFLVFFKVVVSLGIIIFLINQVNFKEIVNLLKNVNSTMIIYAMILLTIQVFIATTRWKLVLRFQKIMPSYKNILQILWSGLFFNQTMPSSVGGDVIRGYYLKKQGMTLGQATLGVLIDRLFGMVGLLVVVVASLPLLFGLINDSAARSGVFFIALSTSLALFIVFFTDKLPGNFSHLRVVKGFYSLSQEGRRCISENYNGIIIIIISVLIHLISVVAVMIMAIGLGINIEWTGFLLIVPLVGVIMVIPISIAGWGVREGAMVVGFGYLGVAQEVALALSILYGLLMLVVALPGGIVWVLKQNHTFD